MTLKLYTYWRASAPWRVRIALAWKNLPYEAVPVHLLKGQQKETAYQGVNPQGLLPALVDGDFTLSQSLAIMEYLEEHYPVPPLLPQGARDRALVRQMALLIACDIHPLLNPRVQKYLADVFGADDAAKRAWYGYWVREGFAALEALVARHGGSYCYGDIVSFADLCLIPQLYNARRFQVKLDDFPKLLAVEARAAQLPAFQAAHADNQPDRE